jgi:hypothetical protein
MNHLKVKFETAASKHGQQCVRSPTPSKPGPPQTPHVSRLMALAIRLEHLIEIGQIGDQAEIARAAGLTRARVTQILNLANLAPDIQQAVLELADHPSEGTRLKEADMRHYSQIHCWEKQRRLFQRLVGGKRK